MVILSSALVDLSLNFPHQLGKENKKQAFSHIRDIAAEHLDQEQRLKVERAIRNEQSTRLFDEWSVHHFAGGPRSLIRPRE